MRNKPLPLTRPRVDAALLADPSARRALVMKEGPRVLAICQRLAADPEDAFQEVWARVFANLHQFDPEGKASIGTWIRTIAHRLLVDRHRRGQVRGAVLPFKDRAGEDSPVEEALLRRRRSAALDHALGELPDPQRRVVVSHHLGGLSLHAIAEAEGVALGTVKSRLHRARGRLAELLEAL